MHTRNSGLWRARWRSESEDVGGQLLRKIEPGAKLAWQLSRSVKTNGSAQSRDASSDALAGAHGGHRHLSWLQAAQSWLLRRSCCVLCFSSYSAAPRLKGRGQSLEQQKSRSSYCSTPESTSAGRGNAREQGPESRAHGQV